jgi:hypothetical protein
MGSGHPSLLGLLTDSWLDSAHLCQSIWILDCQSREQAGPELERLASPPGSISVLPSRSFGCAQDDRNALELWRASN